MRSMILLGVWVLMALPVMSQVKVYTYPSGKDSIEVMHDYRVSICAVADASERWLPVTTVNRRPFNPATEIQQTTSIIDTTH